MNPPEKYEDGWYEGKNSTTLIAHSQTNGTWGHHLCKNPIAKAFRDSMLTKHMTNAEVLNAINSTKSRREQLAILAVAFYPNPDNGNNFPTDEDPFFGEDL